MLKYYKIILKQIIFFILCLFSYIQTISYAGIFINVRQTQEQVNTDNNVYNVNDTINFYINDAEVLKFFDKYKNNCMYKFVMRDINKDSVISVNNLYIPHYYYDLNNGKYVFEVSIFDIQSKEKTATNKFYFEIDNKNIDNNFNNLEKNIYNNYKDISWRFIILFIFLLIVFVLVVYKIVKIYKKKNYMNNEIMKNNNILNDINLLKQKTADFEKLKEEKNSIFTNIIENGINEPLPLIKDLINLLRMYDKNIKDIENIIENIQKNK